MPKSKIDTFWNDEISNEDIHEFINDPKWSYHRKIVSDFNNGRNIKHHARITKESLQLYRILVEQHEVEIFPVCFRVYTKVKSAGEYNWWVDGLNLQTYGSVYPIKELVQTGRVSISRTAWSTELDPD